LDDAEYRVRVESAQADLAAAQGVAGTRTTEGQAEGQVATASGQRSQLDAQVIAAQAANTNAQANLARMKDLAAKQIVSKQQLDAAQAAAAAAEAQLLAAQREVTTAGSQISTAQAGVRIAEARSSAAQAALDNAKLQLNDIKVGQPVDFDVDAYGGCTAHGKVESLSGATGAKFALLPPDNATGNFTKVVQRVPIRIAVTKGCPDHPLRPGLSVNVHVATQ